jgi:predicted metal-binding protein
MKIETALEMARQAGFDVAEPLDPAMLSFRSEVRDMCAACDGYAKSWGCPPAVGSLEAIAKRAAKYGGGVLVQTICYMEDEFDMDSWGESARLHGERFIELARLYTAVMDTLPMGAGGCHRCAEGCTYPDAACRHPDQVYPSMEGYGLMVSDVCRDNGVTYYYGPGTIAFNCCYLFDLDD